MVEIRFEQEADHAAVHEVQRAAFGGPAEARLVAELRDHAHPTISLVAVSEKHVVGHILFSPVTIEGVSGPVPPLGLAPVGVLPHLQRDGIGIRLVEAGLAECRSLGSPFVVVLGHITYYPRFGFEPAFPHGLRSVYPSPPEAFMVLELTPGALETAEGTVHYHEAFGSGGSS
jgi:putative acetyltransferase